MFFTSYARKDAKGERLLRDFIDAVVANLARDGRARVDLQAWGAFTVGASAHQGKTFLELDLAENQSHPEVFRMR